MDAKKWDTEEGLSLPCSQRGLQEASGLCFLSHEDCDFSLPCVPIMCYHTPKPTAVGQTDLELQLLDQQLK